MNSHHLASPTLDYLRSSPVRGQLEPYDPRTAKGWRYIQTTDTLNQLKVLLPPGTASMYEQLLKFEAFELGKKTALSWERILEIRHLKDRMIRKCQKLAKTSAVPRRPGDPFTFQTLIAPSDFRVKEMEKWFQQQQTRTNAILRRQPIRQQTAADINDAIPGRSYHATSPFLNQASRPIPSKSGSINRRLSIYHEVRVPPQRPTLVFPEEKPSSPAQILVPVVTRSVSSPPPLPHLLRIRDLESGFDLSNDPQKIISVNPETPPNEPDLISPESASHDIATSVTMGQLNTTSQVQVRQQRSCIKRSSTGDLAKTVSWADDRDLVGILCLISPSGRKWEEIRDIYVEQMAGLALLHQQVEESLEHLRSETEHLKRADETIRRQRSALRSTFQDFEKKQTRFQLKGEDLLSHGITRSLTRFSPRSAGRCRSRASIDCRS
ncbi:hypothetical protein BDZ94DRAFT_1176402 [Collybia nuda]|uniref:Uncharacterized protein n=1 Tax=Collybia nuda TaxID=64659 RepID=A0A9P6CCE6_9AGAR|nr:hypothetical protein BDZ94DRAFT_1176402 [Collybia nuda]